MAPWMPMQLMVCLPVNEEVAGKLLEKHRSMEEQEQPRGLPENERLALSTVYRNVCAATEPIRTLHDLRRIPGVGPWVIRVMKDSIPRSIPDLSPRNSKGATVSMLARKKRMRTKPYVPQKNSASYAILITLYQEMTGGKDFMMKQELSDAADASGLTQFAIGIQTNPGCSRNNFYTGWSCMKTLLSNALVVKWSNPAKYRLTEEGRKTALDCLARSGLDDPAANEIFLSDSDSDSDELYEGNNPLIG